MQMEASAGFPASCRHWIQLFFCGQLSGYHQKPEKAVPRWRKESSPAQIGTAMTPRPVCLANANTGVLSSLAAPTAVKRGTHPGNISVSARRCRLPALNRFEAIPAIFTGGSADARQSQLDRAALTHLRGSSFAGLEFGYFVCFRKATREGSASSLFRLHVRSATAGSGCGR